MASIYDWSATAAANSSADAGINWVEGQDPGSVNDSARQMMGRIAELLKDLGGTLTVGGTPNGITVTANSGFTTLANGRMLAFIAASDNSGVTTLNANGTGAVAIRRMGLTGDVALAAGEIQAGGIYVVRYNSALNGGAGGWLVLNPTLSAALLGFGTLASAATLDLATVEGAYVVVTGSTGPITAMGTLPRGTMKVLEFAGTPTISHNATLLILPNARDIATTAGDVAIVVSEGSGNWRCLSYTRTGKAAITKVTLFTATGTFTPDPLMIDCIAEAQGNGGAGGGAPACGASQMSVGSGGQAGSYARGRFTKAQIGASQTVTIPVAATGVAGAAGNAGGDVSLGSLLIAKGGGGGNPRGPVSNTNTIFATAGTPALVQSTAGDYLGWTTPGLPGLSSPTDSLAGNGGYSLFGGAGLGATSPAAGGAAKANTGAGGGGAYTTAAATAGGAGGTGVVIVTENLAPY
jgi:hypothetical protein